MSFEMESALFEEWENVDEEIKPAQEVWQRNRGLMQACQSFSSFLLREIRKRER